MLLAVYIGKNTWLKNIVEKEFEDSELGKIVMRDNVRARRIIFRVRPDAIYITVPCGTEIRKVLALLEEYRSKLVRDKARVDRKTIDLNFKIDRSLFQLSLISGQGEKFLAHSELGKTQIICSATARFEDEQLQEWLRKVIKEALRKNAKIVLPELLNKLSTKHALPYLSVKINSSQGRWGSCSMTKNINLSCYLLLLPMYLVEYVLLHELCHTKEMNHGERFWSLLNRFTDGQAIELRNELKNYRTEF